jgi:tRNA threonylcarbamoyl adenosine modification protein YeaZ
VLTLAFDTSTPAVTAAVLDGDRLVGDSVHIDARRHGELLAPGIQAALAAAGATLADVTAVACGNGPGPFTGLRVGLVTARALGHSLGIPAYGVCSLDALAAEVGVAADLVVATDARRREVYWARYAAGRRVAGPAVDRPADLAPRLAGATVVGHGATLYPDLLGAPAPGAPLYPAAEWVARLVAQALAAGDEPDAVAPLYLRRPDAEVPKAVEAVLPA